MSSYSSKPAVVKLTPAELDARFADFSAMQRKLDELPAEQRAQIGNVEFTPDSIVLNTPQVGEIILRAAERKSGYVSLQAEKSPVPMSINISYTAVGDDSSEIIGEMVVDIPAMLRPLVGPTLQKAVDQFGSLFAAMA